MSTNNNAAMPTPTPPKPPQQQVCDNCRFRKMKCDRGLPCSNCVVSSIPCRYLHTLRRKGPRGGKGRRLSQIRQGLTEPDRNHFEVSTPGSAQMQFGVLEEAGRSSRSGGGGGAAAAGRRGGGEAQQQQQQQQNPLLALATATEHDRQRLSVALAAHVQVFMKHLFPIMPVVNDRELLADSLRLDSLSPSRYAFLLSLCAATRIQLKLDSAEEYDETAVGINTSSLDSPLTGEALLSAAEQARLRFNVVDDLSLDTLLTSFFLFAGYGNLEKHTHAWFYLNQAISLALSIGLHSEAAYSNLEESEREIRRRIFWLLFVTERTYALQHRRPVMLRNTISKPQIVDSDCPIVMHDFVNHVRLFELLPCSLYEWQPHTDGCQPQGVALSHAISNKLSAVQPAESVMESQRFDTLVTQQWLRVSMWRLAFGSKPSLVYGQGLMPALGLPFEAGKSIMKALGSVSQSSKDCHGIAIEQKLFDIGMSLADASMSASPMPSFEFGPHDLLSSVVKFLGRIRGCQSNLLPKLLKHSELILGFSNPLAGIDIHWPALLEEHPSVAGSTHVGDLAAAAAAAAAHHAQGDESSSASSSVGSWQDTCDLAMLEPGAGTFMGLGCEEAFDEQVHMAGQVEIA
ncbi:Maltose fermentation regulatory protein MAL63 [Trichoderma ghanense]|uniref:Maltose fermentation regulatory protein MAL63 n=1 Tax=Trichoderma ghanense TaxID=65468 RepID=A0ABY2H8M5_9HYPO